MPKIPLHIPKPLYIDDLYIHPFFFFRYPPEKFPETLFNEELPENFFEKEVVLASLEDCKAIVLPNNFHWLPPEASVYIRKWADIAERFGKPLFIFAFSDYADELVFDPRAHVFLYSIYRDTTTPQSISTPPQSTDLSPALPRLKQEAPVVSFCGRAGFSSVRSMLTEYIKNTLQGLKSLIRPVALAKKTGLYWRRKALRACSRSNLIKTNFIIRNTYSGSRKTIELEPAQARAQFVQSVKDADFVLAPKGDGNSSMRFYEALSAGRIPVLIDTDMVLPFEENIAYDEIMVRVPMQQVHKTPEYIRRFYDSLTPKEWERKQRLAREIFEKYLRQDSFFQYFFTHVLPTLK